VSVRVNLLPREVEERNVARRQQGMLAVAGVVVLLLLGVFFWMQLGRVNDARDELALEEQRRDELQAEVRALQEFADLESELEARNELIALAMGGEISVAGLLQDAAAVTPSDMAFLTLAATLGSEPEGTAFGRVTGTAETLLGHAPGVERVLLSFDKVAAFRDVFVANSTIDEIDITTFTFDFFLGPESLTGRYLTGLPEELR
jgi:Tfp pilus assembly protein PilN